MMSYIGIYNANDVVYPISTKCNTTVVQFFAIIVGNIIGERTVIGTTGEKYA